MSDSPKKKYDFVIVGSGIGGLISSVILALEGFSVLVLEKNHQIGGNLQVFSRDKKIFDTGVHYLGSLDDGENLNQIFKYVGIFDQLKMKRLDEDCYDLIHFPDGQIYKHGQGYNQFKKGLYSSFPDEVNAIDLFCSKIQEYCNYFPLYNLEHYDASKKNYIDDSDLLTASAWDFVTSITDNKRLQSVLVGNGPLYAGDQKRTPLFVLALIMNSYLKGSYRMVDGSSQIAIALMKRLRELGGELLRHQEVISAEQMDGEIVSVKTTAGDEFFGKNFISNAHPVQTVKMFGEDRFRPAYRKRLDTLKNTVSSFMLYLSFHEDSFPFYNHNIYAYSKENAWDTVDYDKSEWPEALYITTPPTKGDNKYADCMSVMAYMDFSEVEQWKDTFNTVAASQEREAEYQEFKTEKENRVIAQLESIFPDIRKSIKSQYSSTPLTYRDYIGTDDGSMYGIEKDVNSIMFSKINARTKIPNVFQTGQNIVFHGILGASIGSLVTCFNFINDKELITKIKNA